MKKLALFFVFSLFVNALHSQFLMDMVDTTKDVGKGLLSIYKKFDQIRIGGYIQPEYQVAQEKGIKSYAGGDFPENVSNRFLIRRGRIRFEYAKFNDEHKASVQFVFQFDGTERGVFIRDFWGRYFENKLELFSFSMGMFARPFGYEVNLASSDRESPERGRMSQILMKTERDLGAMVSFEPRKKNHPLAFLKLDLGFFNGPGLTAPADYDSYKDIISRISIKPIHLSSSILFSTGVSWLEGGFMQNTPNIYRMQSDPNGDKNFILDSSSTNIGKKNPRRYYGADAQIKIKNRWGFTELRGEYIFGQQTSTFGSSETPSALLQEPAFIRRFNGAYFYFIQNIINPRHQLCLKYDWYDPNTDLTGRQIGMTGSHTGAADIKYSTLGFGYNFYCNENLKLVLWCDIVKNESTMLPEYADDLKDNVFTVRLQFRF